MTFFFALARTSGSAVFMSAVCAIVACSSNPSPAKGDAGAPGTGADDAAIATLDSSATSDAPVTGMKMSCSADGGACPSRTPTTTTIVGTAYSSTGSTMVYGAAPDQWVVMPFADPGQTAPTLSAGPGAITVNATLAASAVQASTGFSLIAAGSECINESNFARGLTFSLSGDLGGCTLFVDSLTAENVQPSSDDCRGSCAATSTCTPATTQVTMTNNVTVANMAFMGGAPQNAGDGTQVIGFRMRLVPPSSAGCTVDVTIGPVQFLGL